MQKIPLYCYNRPDGGTTNTLRQPEHEDYTLRWRLIADAGMLLRLEGTVTECVDTDRPDDWAEIENTEEN